MSIRRSARKQRFTTVDNQVFASGLSYRAMGLLTYLLSKPDHWQVSVAQLVKNVSESAKPDGRDAVYAIIAELEDKGFIVRRRKRSDSGRMSGIEYVVHDTPQPAEPEEKPPHPAQPDAANPHTGEPHAANPTQVNTEGLVNTETPANTDILGDTSPQTEQDKPAAKKKSKRGTQLPDDFQPGEQHVSLAAELGVDLAHEFPQFADYHRAKGSVMKDWSAALRTWLRNAAKFAARKPGGQGGNRPGYMRGPIQGTNFHEGVNEDGSF